MGGDNLAVLTVVARIGRGQREDGKGFVPAREQQMRRATVLDLAEAGAFELPAVTGVDG